MIGFGSEDLGTECSRAGCRNDATWTIAWRNPKIHTADRVKLWLACDEHREFLQEFLGARDFPLAVAAMTDPVPTAGELV